LSRSSDVGLIADIESKRLSFGARRGAAMEGTLKEGMLCPVCRVDLMMSNREGVEIDYCPRCRGVWLDRGELDKIVERSLVQERPAPAATPDYRATPREEVHRDRGYPDERNRQHRDWDDDRNRGDYGRHKHKRRGWLGDLLDFD
jgi:Zn-finger nucleic acid-binding protein